MPQTRIKENRKHAYFRYFLELSHHNFPSDPKCEGRWRDCEQEAGVLIRLAPFTIVGSLGQTDGACGNLSRSSLRISSSWVCRFLFGRRNTWCTSRHSWSRSNPTLNSRRQMLLLFLRVARMPFRLCPSAPTAPLFLSRGLH